MPPDHATQLIPPWSSAEQDTGSLAGRIKSDAENAVGDETLQPRGARARRAARGNAGAHAGLHQQEGRRHGTDPDDQGRPDRRVANPCVAPDGWQDGRKRDTDQVVGDPADQAFAAPRPTASTPDNP